MKSTYSLDGILRALSHFPLVINKLESSARIIHITGTNGKGSVVRILEHLYLEHGVSVQSFSSPCITSIYDQIRINARPVCRDLLRWAWLQVDRTNVNLSHFEQLFACACLIFAQAPAQVILIEVGCGGALDATNIFSHPAICAFTKISQDHIDILGNVPSIARHKSGIIKEGCRVVIGKQQHMDALDIIHSTAEKLACEIFSYGINWFTSDNIFSFPAFNCEIPIASCLDAIELHGTHQAINLSTGLAIFAASSDMLGIKPCHSQIGKMSHPGRLQKIEVSYKQSPLVQDIWLDGGHNTDAIRCVTEFLRGKTFDVLIGMSGDKDMDTATRILKSACRRLIHTIAPHTRCPRDCLPKGGVNNWLLGLQLLLADHDTEGKKYDILICGSFGLVKAVLQAFPRNMRDTTLHPMPPFHFKHQPLTSSP